MAQAGVNFRGFFPAGCRAFQFLNRVVQPARRGELHRVPQGAGFGGAQRLGLGGGGIAAHQPFYQFVIYKESLFVILRHVLLLKSRTTHGAMFLQWRLCD